MFPLDLHDVIVSFIGDFKDLMSWRHTCQQNFHDYTANFTCTRMYPFIRTPFVEITTDTNLSLLSRRHYIKSIIINDGVVKSEHLMNLVNLEHLEIWSHIYTLDVSDYAFSKLSKLRVLHCKNVNITDDSLKRLTNLTELNCSSCVSLTYDSLSKLTNLVTLNCINNPKLDTSFVKHLTKLENLTIDSSVQNHKDALSKLINLKYLKLSRDGIRPDIVKILPGLEFVDCMKNEFTDEHIMHLKNLKTLICGVNSFFTDLSFKNLTNLETLKATKTNIVVSFEVFSKLTNLTEFHSGTLQIPSSVFKDMSRMEILHCEDNLLLTDECLSYLPNLTELDCGRNVNFTDDGISKLSKLRTLNCGSNHNFTDDLFDYLPHLTSFNCGFNRNFNKGLKKASSRLNSVERIYCVNDDSNHPVFMDVFTYARVIIQTR